MDTEKETWHPIFKISDSLTMMAKREFKNTVYALLYKHTFSFVSPHKLLEAETFNIKYKEPKDIPTIAEKLRYFRYKKALLQKDVAKQIGINQSTYISYESDNRDYYPIDTLKKISALYEVNIIELLDEYNLFLYIGQGLQLKKLRKQLGLTQKALADRLNIHTRTVRQWEKNRARMPKSTYVKIFKNKILY